LRLDCLPDFLGRPDLQIVRAGIFIPVLPSSKVRRFIAGYVGAFTLCSDFLCFAQYIGRLESNVIDYDFVFLLQAVDEFFWLRSAHMIRPEVDLWRCSDEIAHLTFWPVEAQHHQVYDCTLKWSELLNEYGLTEWRDCGHGSRRNISSGLKRVSEHIGRYLLVVPVCSPRPLSMFELSLLPWFIQLGLI